MQLSLLALLLADSDTAVAKIGTQTDKGMLPMFEVPLAYEGLTAEKVTGIISDLQAKVDHLGAIYDACQPRLVSAPTAVLGNVAPFGKPRLN